MNAKLNRLFPLLLPAAAFAAFAPALANGFVNWDDYTSILHNTSLAQFSATNITTIINGKFAAVPLTMLSFLLERQIAGTAPFLYHFDNLLLHSANAYLVYRIFTLLSGQERIGLLTAALFALHPLRVESVAWATERKDVLYAFFYLLSIKSYLRHVTGPGRAGIPALSLLFFALSTLSKPMAVTLPIILLLSDFQLRRKFSARIFLEKLPYAAIAAAYAAYTLYRQAGAVSEPLPLPTRLLIALHNVFLYAGKILFPIKLSVLYPMSQQPAAWVSIAELAAAGILAWLCWRLRDSFRELSVGLLFFLWSLLPVLQLIPTAWTTFADRFTYLASVGIAFIFATLFFSKERGKAANYALAIVLLLLAVSSFQRCFVWKNSVSLWSDVLIKYPASGIALNNRGKAYSEAGEHHKAYADFDKALETDPNSVIFLSNRASAGAKLGNYGQALQDLTKALAIDPGAAVLYANRGAVHMLSGQTEQAIADFKKVLESNPQHAGTLTNLKIAEDALKTGVRMN